MAQNELDSLLAALEPEAAADATLPAGFKLSPLRAASIGPPIAIFETVRRGNRAAVSVPTAESRKLAKAAATIRFPVLDRSHESAVAIWEERYRKIEEYQREIAPAAKPAAKPASERPISSRPMVIRI